MLFLTSNLAQWATSVLSRLQAVVPTAPDELRVPISETNDYPMGGDPIVGLTKMHENA